MRFSGGPGDYELHIATSIRSSMMQMERIRFAIAQDKAYTYLGDIYVDYADLSPEIVHIRSSRATFDEILRTGTVSEEDIATKFREAAE